MDQVYSCPKCHSSIQTSDFFCKACGFKLKEKPLSTSIFRQLLIYLFSFLLPPLGLIPAIKYLRQDGRESKKVGIIIIVITIISLIFSVWLFFYFTNSLNNLINKQMGDYENLSF